MKPCESINTSLSLKLHTFIISVTTESYDLHTNKNKSSCRREQVWLHNYSVEETLTASMLQNPWVSFCSVFKYPNLNLYSYSVGTYNNVRALCASWWLNLHWQLEPAWATWFFTIPFEINVQYENKFRPDRTALRLHQLLVSDEKIWSTQSSSLRLPLHAKQPKEQRGQIEIESCMAECYLLASERQSDQLLGCGTEHSVYEL